MKVYVVVFQDPDYESEGIEGIYTSKHLAQMCIWKLRKENKITYDEPDSLIIQEHEVIEDQNRLGPLSEEVKANLDYINSFSDPQIGIAALSAGITDKDHARKLGLY